MIDFECKVCSVTIKLGSKSKHEKSKYHQLRLELSLRKEQAVVPLRELIITNEYSEKEFLCIPCSKLIKLCCKSNHETLKEHRIHVELTAKKEKEVLETL